MDPGSFHNRYSVSVPIEDDKIHHSSHYASSREVPKRNSRRSRLITYGLITMIVLVIILLVSPQKSSSLDDVTFYSDNSGESYAPKFADEQDFDSSVSEKISLGKTAKKGDKIGSGKAVPLKASPEELDGDSTLEDARPDVPGTNPNLPANNLVGQSNGAVGSAKLTRQASGNDWKLVEYDWNIPESTDSDPSVKEVVVLSLFNKEDSFGRHGDKQRTFDDFLDVVKNQEYPAEKLSLGVVVGGKDLFDSMNEKFKALKASSSIFRKVTLIHSTRSLESMSRADRKGDAVQGSRRRLLSSLRNFVLTQAIGDTYGSFWIDSDMMKIPEGTLKKMVESEKDIITTSCTIYDEEREYDLNAWKGPRLKPQPGELEDGSFVPNKTPDTRYVDHFKDGEEEFVEFDSVGGTVLYVKSDVHRLGAIFPPLYIIGADWDRTEGYDGIESEGICYIAKSLGFKCWAMPHVTSHHSH